jgi:hypothetical protein
MLVAKKFLGRIHLVYDCKLIIKLDSESCTINYKAFLMHRKWTKLRPLLSISLALTKTLAYVIQTLQICYVL